MKDFAPMFRFQLQHMIKRRRFLFLLLFIVVIITLSFLETCWRYYGIDISLIPSAATGWIGRTPRPSATPINPAIFCTFQNFLFLPAGAMVFADFYMTDQKEKIYSIAITRGSANAYHCSGAILCFLGAFAVMLVPLLLFYPISFFLFPAESMVNPFSNVRSLWDMPRFHENWVLFPALFYGHPHLSNIMYLVYNSLLAGVWSLFSYTLSYFLRLSKALIYIIPTVFLLLTGHLSGFITERISLIQYMNPTRTSGVRYPAAFWAYLLIPLFFSLLFLFLRIKKESVDEL